MRELGTRRLGRTGMTPGALGLGAAWLHSQTEEETVAAIERSLALGMNYLDTYPGRAEERWGKALSGGRRQQVYLQAKVSSHVGNEMKSDHTAAATRRSVENSLRSFRTDYLDSVLIHGHDQLDDIGDPASQHVDPLAPGNALEELVKMRDEGSIRHVGIGARAAAVHRRAIDTREVDLILTYLEYNLLTQAAAAELFPTCREHHIGVILGSPLGMGLLTGREVDEADERDKIRDTVEPKGARMLSWCGQRSLDIRYLAIQYCLAAPVESIVLPGQASLEEVEGTHEAATAEISADAWREFGEDFDVDVSTVIGE